jgi:diguanylate cyclase (GGDEF)-like protein/PAS domain S-box-containing protein
MSALHARIALAALAAALGLLILLTLPWPWQAAAALPALALVLSVVSPTAPAGTTAAAQGGALAAAAAAPAVAMVAAVPVPGASEATAGMAAPARGSEPPLAVRLANTSGNTSFEALTEYSTDLAAVIALDGRVRHVSRNLGERIAGGDRSLLDLPFTELVHAGDRARWLACLAEFADARNGAQRSVHLDRLRLLRPGADPLYIDMRITDHRATPGLQGLVMNARDVTDRITIERALARNESKFASVFHASADGIVIARATDLLVLDFNPSFTRLLGVTRQHAIGTALDALGLWPAAEVARGFLARLRGSATGLDERVTLRHSETGQPLEARISARYTEIDGELALLLVVRDETDNEQTRHALREIERKFTMVFNAAPDGIVIVRASDHVIVDVNDYMCGITGFGREELLGNQMGALRVFDDAPTALHARQMLERLGGFRNLELTLRHREGEVIPALVSASVVNLDGEACVLILVRDIRDQRRAEQALRRADARFRNAFEDAPIGVALVDAQLGMIDGNHWLADMLGVKRDTLGGLGFATVVPEDERAGLCHALLQLLPASGSDAAGPLHREQTLLGPDGQLRQAILHAVLQQDEADEPPYFIVQLVDITDIKRSQEQMERLAFYDPLTGLANRRLFMDRLEQSLQHTRRSGKPAALLFLDLDQFKAVNDTHGHDVGDELLKTIADRLRHAVRREDTVARLGGDEFNVLLHEVRDVDAAGQVAEHLLSVLREPAIVGGTRLEVTTSIGIAMIPSDGGDATSLAQRADHAMYQAKQQGRNTYRFYADSLSSRFTERMGFAHSLEQALTRDELTLFYQPMYMLDDATADGPGLPAADGAHPRDVPPQGALHGALLGIEALLRWQHPQRGLLEPAAFLDASEHAGLMRELDLWALRQGLKHLQGFDAAGYLVPSLALNLSGRHIGDGQFVRTLHQCVLESGIAPARISLELSERLLARDLDLAQQWLQSLRALGFAITIDDFGAEASSINAITRLPVQRVKLDNSVVQRLSSSRDALLLTDTVVGLCRQIGRELVAEGIETEDQRQRLLRAGCAYGQGYLLGAPRTAIELAQLLRGTTSAALPAEQAGDAMDSAAVHAIATPSSAPSA